jgi:fatty acid-binding protein DegV
MKTKIVTCSTSSIDYIPHEGIDVIPSVMIFNELEEYREYVDLSFEAYYNRVTYDKKIKVTSNFITYNELIKKVKSYEEEGYKQVIFITDSEEISTFTSLVGFLKDEEFDIKVKLFDTNTCGYPLAYIANAANQIAQEDFNYTSFIKKLSFYRDYNKIYFITQKKRDAKKNIITSVLSFNNGKLVPVEIEKGILVNDFVKSIFDRESNKNITPFIQYTNNSRNDILDEVENLMIDYYSNIRKVKSYPLSPTVSLKINNLTMAVGFIRNK